MDWESDASCRLSLLGMVTSPVELGCVYALSFFFVVQRKRTKLGSGYSEGRKAGRKQLNKLWPKAFSGHSFFGWRDKDLLGGQ